MSGRRIATVTLIILAAGASVAAALHTHLVKADPAVDATVAETPSVVRLWFNERPEVALSAAVLLKDTAPIARIVMAKTDDSLSISGPVPVKLDPGEYTVQWKTGSADGHPVRGSYKFTFTPAAP